jgi:hypothetical protein
MVHDWYSLPNIIALIKSRRMMWVEQVGGEENIEFWWGNLKE